MNFHCVPYFVSRTQKIKNTLFCWRWADWNRSFEHSPQWVQQRPPRHECINTQIWKRGWITTQVFFMNKSNIQILTPHLLHSAWCESLCQTPNSYQLVRAAGRGSSEWAITGDNTVHSVEKLRYSCFSRRVIFNSVFSLKMTDKITADKKFWCEQPKKTRSCQSDFFGFHAVSMWDHAKL